MTLGPVIVNRLFPSRFASAKAEEALATIAPTRDAALDAMLDAGRMMHDRRKTNDRSIALLAQALPGERAELPYLFTPTLGPIELDELSKRLETQLVS